MLNNIRNFSKTFFAKIGTVLTFMLPLVPEIEIAAIALFCESIIGNCNNSFCILGNGWCV